MRRTFALRRIGVWLSVRAGPMDARALLALILLLSCTSETKEIAVSRRGCDPTGCVADPNPHCIFEDCASSAECPTGAQCVTYGDDCSGRRCAVSSVTVSGTRELLSRGFGVRQYSAFDRTGTGRYAVFTWQVPPDTKVTQCALFG